LSYWQHQHPSLFYKKHILVQKSGQLNGCDFIWDSKLYVPGTDLATVVSVENCIQSCSGRLSCSQKEQFTDHISHVVWGHKLQVIQQTVGSLFYEFDNTQFCLIQEGGSKVGDWLEFVVFEGAMEWLRAPNNEK